MHPILDQVAISFWFLKHIELNFELLLAEDAKHVRPYATISGVCGIEEIWRHLWNGISRRRLEESHLITIPRLRSLDVVTGSFRPASLPPLSETERREQLRFTVDLSERDDEAWKGIAKVRCVELEALKVRMGSPPSFEDRYQEELMKFVEDRAYNGPAVIRASHIKVDAEWMRSSSFWDKYDPLRFHYRLIPY